DRVEAAALGRRGRVLLAATRGAVARGFPTDVQESLRSDAPEIALVVLDFEQPGPAAAVADGRADLGVGVESALPAELQAQRLWVETLDRVIVPWHHPLATRDSVTLADLSGLPFVFGLDNASTAVRDRVAQTLARAGLRSPLIALEGDLTAPHMAVAAERGWTLITRSRASAPPEGTVVLSIEGVSVPVAVIAVWRRTERRPVVLTVLRRILEVARGYPDSEVRDAESPALPPLPRPVRAQRPRGTVPSGITLRYLRALTSVATAHSIGRAAHRLGISQPALSRQLRELEHALGATLLERSARGVSLTPAGVTLATDTPALLAAADQLIREVSRAKRRIEGRCVIGTVATAASSSLLARVIERCADRHPDIDLVVQEMTTPEQRSALANADIDLGLAHALPTPGWNRGDRIVATRLVNDRLDTALLALGHPLAARQEIEPQQLADVPFLFMDRSLHPAFYDRVHGALAALGLRPRVDATYDALQTVWALAAQGKGWTVGFHSQLDRSPVGTVAVRIAGFSLPFGLELLSRRGETSQAVLTVIGAFRELRRTTERPTVPQDVDKHATPR
ncbi:MAG TPA: LysR substrate-binding domain-containing protein, partial [Gemmatimonadales bacterium]|nr:LysR substrate-binding domain-containing protein [Gemmatimonadales bacterium]